GDQWPARDARSLKRGGDDLPSEHRRRAIDGIWPDHDPPQLVVRGYLGISEEPESGSGSGHDIRRHTCGRLLSGIRRQSDGQLPQEGSGGVIFRIRTKTRGEMIYLSTGFEGLHFSEPPEMAFFSCKSRAQESADQLARQFRTDHTRAQGQNIHVIVFYSLMGRVGV